MDLQYSELVSIARVCEKHLVYLEVSSWLFQHYHLWVHIFRICTFDLSHQSQSHFALTLGFCLLLEWGLQICSFFRLDFVPSFWNTLSVPLILLRYFFRSKYLSKARKGPVKISFLFVHLQQLYYLRYILVVRYVSINWNLHLPERPPCSHCEKVLGYGPPLPFDQQTFFCSHQATNHQPTQSLTFPRLLILIKL